jgi:hypothetical protein
MRLACASKESAVLADMATTATTAAGRLFQSFEWD